MTTTYLPQTGPGKRGTTAHPNILVSVHVARQNTTAARQRRDWEAERRLRQQELAVPVRVGFLRRLLRLLA